MCQATTSNRRAVQVSGMPHTKLTLALSVSDDFSDGSSTICKKDYQKAIADKLTTTKKTTKTQNATPPSSPVRSCMKKEGSPKRVIKKVITTEPSPSSSKKNGKKQKNKRQKIVTFKPKVRVRKSLHLNDYTEEEFDDSFLSESDYSVIEEMFNITQQLLELGEDEDEDSGICFRGVEEHLDDETERRNEIVSIVLDTVLVEQRKYESKRGLKDCHEHMANKCRQHTIQSVQEAIAKAKEDEEYVSSIWRANTRKEIEVL